MKRSASYNTKQRAAILQYVASLDGAHVTAAQTVAHFAGGSVSIGRTTVYRHLEKLTENGQLRRYTTDGISGACYQFVGVMENCDAHLHLKCEDCGELIHLECHILSELERHVLARHAFRVNVLKTVLYGKCDDCIKRPVPSK